MQSIGTHCPGCVPSENPFIVEGIVLDYHFLELHVLVTTPPLYEAVMQQQKQKR